MNMHVRKLSKIKIQDSLILASNIIQLKYSNNSFDCITLSIKGTYYLPTKKTKKQKQEKTTMKIKFVSFRSTIKRDIHLVLYDEQPLYTVQKKKQKFGDIIVVSYKNYLIPTAYALGTVDDLTPSSSGIPRQILIMDRIQHNPHNKIFYPVLQE